MKNIKELTWKAFSYFILTCQWFRNRRTFMIAMKKKKLRGLGPRANYIGQATAAYWRS
jgi:hypothetical protein